MKKVTLVAMVLVCSVAFTNCAAKKPVAQQSQPVAQQTEEDDLDRQIKQMEKEAKLRELKRAQERADLEEKRKQELEDLEYEARKRKLETSIATTASTVSGDRKIVVYCKEETIDKGGEYMAGLGVSSEQDDERRALKEANTAAIADIVQRMMGDVVNGYEDYAKNTGMPSGNKLKEDELESFSMNACQKAVNKYAQSACREVVNTADGQFKAYIAVHVPLAETASDIADQLAEAGIVHKDKESFKKSLMNQLDANTRKKQEEQQRTLDMLNSL